MVPAGADFDSYGCLLEGARQSRHHVQQFLGPIHKSRARTLTAYDIDGTAAIEIDEVCGGLVLNYLIEEGDVTKYASMVLPRPAPTLTLAVRPI